MGMPTHRQQENTNQWIKLKWVGLLKNGSTNTIFRNWNEMFEYNSPIVVTTTKSDWPPWDIN